MSSKSLFSKAQKYMVGGVNSPVRAFKSVGGTPVFIQRGKGPWIWDADGKRYADFVGSWGPLILGHAHPQVITAVKKQLSRGFSFGACTDLEIEMAQLVCQAFPSVEKVRFVSSGTEAVMSAIRLARGFTRRNKIVKFIGCYHGHSDSLLVKAGSGAATLGIPDSAGVPQSFSQETIVLPYNDPDSVKQCFKKIGNQIAALIVEPVAGNMGLVLPKSGFLEGLRAITLQYDSLLIFDEVITGFRLAYGGAQTIYKIKPDLTCLGKIIGGGFPVGAFGGKKKFMDSLAPLGNVYQAGTLSGNPVAMTAGIATMQILKKMNPYDMLEKKTEELVMFLREEIAKLNVPIQINHAGSMFTLFFTDRPVADYESAKMCNTLLFAHFYHALLKNGIYFPPSQFETAFLSIAHTETLIEKSAVTISKILKNLT